jgi:hypothetical protein
MVIAEWNMIIGVLENHEIVGGLQIYNEIKRSDP